MITWNVSETDSQLVLPLYSKNKVLPLLHLQLLKTCEELAANDTLHESYHRWLVVPLKSLKTTLTIPTLHHILGPPDLFLSETAVFDMDFKNCLLKMPLGSITNIFERSFG